MKAWLFYNFLLMTIISGGGCCHMRNPSSQQDPAVPGTSGDRPWMRTELYFGLRMPKGMVSEEQWNAFLKEEVTSRFAGLTVVGAYGQWRDDSGKVEGEPSRLVIIFHPDDAKSHTLLEEIRAHYCSKFKQQSVLRADETTVVSFGGNSEQTRSKLLLLQ
jgi:hypothetical protein